MHIYAMAEEPCKHDVQDDQMHDIIVYQEIQDLIAYDCTEPHCPYGLVVD